LVGDQRFFICIAQGMQKGEGGQNFDARRMANIDFGTRDTLEFREFVLHQQL